MLAYYDLACSPPTYDVVTFLLAAERERLKRGAQGLTIEILPGPVEGFRNDRLWPRDIATRKLLLARIVIPMCRMLPSCTSLKVRNDRPDHPEAGSIGYGNYLIGFQTFVACMGEGIRPLRLQDGVTRRPNLITLTLRECEHHPARNSKIGEWIDAARTLKRIGFEIVVVRDSRNMAASIDGVEISPEAAFNLASRAALYRSAACNLFISNGPAWFACALDVPTLIMRPTTDAAGPIYGTAHFANIGLRRGQSMRGAPGYQELCWQDDLSSNIVQAAVSFMRRNPLNA